MSIDAMVGTEAPSCHVSKNAKLLGEEWRQNQYATAPSATFHPFLTSLATLGGVGLGANQLLFFQPEQTGAAYI